jgi:hypothetical protein
MRDHREPPLDLFERDRRRCEAEQMRRVGLTHAVAVADDDGRGPLHFARAEQSGEGVAPGFITFGRARSGFSGWRGDQQGGVDGRLSRCRQCRGVVVGLGDLVVLAAQHGGNVSRELGGLIDEQYVQWAFHVRDPSWFRGRRGGLAGRGYRPARRRTPVAQADEAGSQPH